MTHLRVWRFRPPHGRERDFIEPYSSDGDWARLFRRAPGFRGTRLLRASEPEGWWLTIDEWDSWGAFDAFQREFGEEYRRLDARLEGIAGDEEFIGAFEEED